MTLCIFSVVCPLNAIDDHRRQFWFLFSSLPLSYDTCVFEVKPHSTLPYHYLTTSEYNNTMGILISRLFESLFGSKEVRILILGLDNAGKTTILYRLQNESDEAVQTIPTIGFNVETLQYKNIKVSLMDIR